MKPTDRQPSSSPAAGPFDDSAQVRTLPAVRAVYEAMRASHNSGTMAEGGYRILEAACSAAGVQTGTYDRGLMLWLAGFGPEYCAVFAGLITRAALASDTPGADQ
jgi:hypothetical protein